MKINKNLSWLKEYLELAQEYVPALKNIKEVKELYHQKNKMQRIQGSLSYDIFFGNYTLSLYTTYKRIEVKNRRTKAVIKPYSTIDVLSTLAHEIAHLKYWDHTPKHKMLESQLTMLFMEHLEKLGYISEEEEFS